MAKQINTKSILGKQLIIYQRVTNGYYWMKVKLPKETAVRESLNTKIEEDAIVEAKKRYLKLEQRANEGLSLDIRKTVGQVTYRYKEYLRGRPKGYAQHTCKSRIITIDNYLYTVRDNLLSDMSKHSWLAEIEKWKVSFEKKYKKQMSAGTESHIRNTINQLYSFCIDVDRVISERDRVRLPTVRRDMRKERRPAWSEEDLLVIRNKSLEWIAQSKDKRVKLVRTLIYYYYRFNLHIGLRPVELKNLKYKDIFQKNGYWYFNVHGKDHQGTAVLNKDGEKYLKLLMELHKEITNVNGETHFFMNTNGALFKSYWLNFNHMLAYADKKYISDSGLTKAATFYSSRHSYITYRIGSGVSPYDLTKNVRTSLNMIEKVYDKTTSKELTEELTKNTFNHPKEELSTEQLIALLKDRLKIDSIDL